MTPRKPKKNGKATKRPVGRPHALDDEPEKREKINQLLGHLKDFKSKTVAAANAGFTWGNVSKWVDRGRSEESGKFRDFYLAFMRAREDLIQEVAAKAMNQDPKWFLANELREEFTLKLEVEHSGGLKMELAGEIRDGLKKVLARPEVANRLADEVLGG